MKCGHSGAIAVNEDGYCKILCTAEGMKKDKATWASSFQYLRGRGLDGRHFPRRHLRPHAGLRPTASCGGQRSVGQ